jgi:hypothetical protein
VDRAVAQQRPVDRHAGLVHGGSIAVHPGAAAEDALWPAHHGDAPVAEAKQVARRGQAAVPIGRPDRRRVVVRFARRVDDHERDVAGPQLGLHRVTEVREDGDDAEGTPGHYALDPAPPGRPPPLHLREHDGQVAPPGHALHAADDLQRPLALEFMEDDLEQRRMARRP